MLVVHLRQAQSERSVQFSLENSKRFISPISDSMFIYSTCGSLLPRFYASNLFGFASQNKLFNQLRLFEEMQCKHSVPFSISNTKRVINQQTVMIFFTFSAKNSANKAT